MVPRLPIPNRTVKRLSADDSVVLPCESRSLPNTHSEDPRNPGVFALPGKNVGGGGTVSVRCPAGFAEERLETLGYSF